MGKKDDNGTVPGRKDLGTSQWIHCSGWSRGGDAKEGNKRYSDWTEQGSRPEQSEQPKQKNRTREKGGIEGKERGRSPPNNKPKPEKGPRGNAVAQAARPKAREGEPNWQRKESKRYKWRANNQKGEPNWNKKGKHSAVLIPHPRLLPGELSGTSPSIIQRFGNHGQPPDWRNSVRMKIRIRVTQFKAPARNRGRRGEEDLGNFLTKKMKEHYWIRSTAGLTTRSCHRRRRRFCRGPAHPTLTESLCNNGQYWYGTARGQRKRAWLDY